MNKKLIKFCIFLICPGLFPPLVLSESVPGGIAIIDLDVGKRPRVYYQGNQVMVIGNPDNWQAVVGIGLDALPGSHNLEIDADGIKTGKKFEVSDKQYETQHINIKDKRKVNPNKLDMERINSEKKLIEAAKTSWRDINLESLDLILPVQGRLSSPFGLRRYFNQQARRPHSGLDIASAEGTPIKAAAAGLVINSGDYFFNGNTVFIDHGQGMITMYCHMHSIDVKEGQELVKGDIIGSVGQTGRVTGAHLHWSVILNQTMVDPEFFISNKQAETE